MKKTHLLFTLLFLILSCQQEQHHSYSYYYWKTKLSLDAAEKTALKKATLPVLYTRFFDVDKINGNFVPVGVISKDKSFDTSKKIVPVVYIMTHCFYGIKKEEISQLAKSVTNLIQQKEKDFQFSPTNEIQIDCDWTSGIKNDYFQFLKELQKVSGKEITSTLRLHQVKDKHLAGIPPVKKVYLMCYSTSSPLENSNKNSILDVTLLKNYLSKIEDYPIKNIEVALPIYSWGIVTNHLGKHKLINALSSKDLENPNFKNRSDNEVIIQKDGFYFGNYLNKDFKIKVEEISNEQRQSVISFLEKKIPKFNIVYYQLDSKFVQNKNF